MVALALIVNAALLVGAFVAGLVLRHGSRRRSLIVCAAALTVCLAKGLIARWPEIETALFPWPDYVLFSGWIGPLAMLVVGALGALVRRRREWAFLTLAGLATVVYSADFLFWLSGGAEGAAAALLRNRDGQDGQDGQDTGRTTKAGGPMLSGAWPDRVRRAVRPEDLLCSQTTDYTCGPAAAASMLRLLGIDADEIEMAALCLTRPGRGTLDLGMYRGLNLKLRDAGARRRVRILRLDPDDLAAVRTPCILRVRLGSDHMVVLLETHGDRLVVFDPSTPHSRLIWDRRWLTQQARWSGLAFVPVPAPN
jgi:hypothetical protein